MSKVVQIHSRQFLGRYHHAQRSARIPEQWLDLATIILAVALPQITCIVYGLIPLAVFTATTSAGVGLGWFINRYMPRPVICCVSLRGRPQAPPGERASGEKAA